MTADQIDAYRAIVEALQHEYPLSCRDLQMLCNIGSTTARLCVQRLLEAGIIERDYVVRIVDKKPQRISTRKYVLTKAFKYGKIGLERVGVRPDFPDILPLGRTQRAILTALEDGGQDARTLKARIDPDKPLSEINKSLRKLLVRGFVEFDGQYWSRKQMSVRWP
jgi:hypothetical protein